MATRLRTWWQIYRFKNFDSSAEPLGGTWYDSAQEAWDAVEELVQQAPGWSYDVKPIEGVVNG